MIENHEILCPAYISCGICQAKRDQQNVSKIIKLFAFEDDIQMLNKHFYHLTISLTPKRETYHRFNIDPLKKAGRELINGLSSLSSVSNRKWWSMYVKSGVRYYSIDQKNEQEYPTFKHHFIFYGDKDNLDARMNTQLNYRLKKIHKYFNFEINYLGQYNINRINDSIKIGVNVNTESEPIIKLGEEVLMDINKIRDQKPIVFGDLRNRRNINKLEIKLL